MHVDSEQPLSYIRSQTLRGLRYIQHPANRDRYAGNGSRIGWTWGYLGRAAAGLFRHTGDQVVLREFRGAFRKILGWRDDQAGGAGWPLGNTAPTWSTERRIADGRMLRFHDVATTGLILLPLTDMLIACRKRSYESDFSDLMRNVVCHGLDAHLPELEMHEHSSGVYFRYPVDNEVEPLNHAHLFGAAAADAFALFGHERYRRTAEGIHRFFTWARYLEKNDTVSWAYRPTTTDRRIEHPHMRYPTGFKHSHGGELFYKGAVTIELPLAMRRSGLISSDDDLDLIARSIARNVFVSDNSINYYISPRKIHLSDDMVVRSQPLLRPHFLLSFLRLCPFDSSGQLRKRLQTFVSSRPDWFPHGVLTTQVGLHAGV